MANIKPTQNFVLVQFVSKDGNPTPIILPDGAKDPDSKVVILALGPDVLAPSSLGAIPATPLYVGASVILRGDSKHFEAGPGSEQLQIALVDHRSIIAVVEETPSDFAEVVEKGLWESKIEATRIG